MNLSHANSGPGRLHRLPRSFEPVFTPAARGRFPRGNP